MKKITTLVLVLFVSYVSANSQNVHNSSTLNSGGGQAEINNNTYEWSIGEMTAVHTSSATNIQVTQGLLQPTEGTVGIKNEELNVEVKAYPNPCVDILQVEIKDPALNNIRCQVYDAKGALILRKDFENNPSLLSLDLQFVTAGMYVLKVSAQKQNKPIEGEFKIQKL